jgi:serine/threonine protein kinase
VVAAPDIPGHTVTGVLGSGGFATVYRTWQVAIGRETAVKVDSRVLHTERDQRRFFREVNAAGQLSGHPHVITVYDAGTLRDGRPYLVMELCPDGSLNDAVRRDGPLSAESVCRIGAGLADALAAAHASGILHRDIKPANILINRYGVVGLSDFGLASIIAASGEQSVTREALTPAYAPPESFDAAEPTAVADIYSLGATLYALLAGRPPRFPADGRSPGVATILALHMRPVDDLPGVPPAMMAILRQCLAADPERRLPSAATLRDELAALLGQPTAGPARAAAPPPGEPSPWPDAAPPPSQRASSLWPDAAAPWPDAVSPSQGAGPLWPDAGPPSSPLSPAHSVRSAAGPSPAGPYPAGTAPSARFAPAGYAAETRPPDQRSLGAAATRRWRPLGVAAVVGGGLVLVVIAALIVGIRLLAPGGSTAATGTSGTTGTTTRTGVAGAIGTFGVATTVSNCPAASVAGAGARCTAAPECWNGLVETEGIITAGTLPCRGPHTWQTFAIGVMPSDAASYDVDTVQANPTVRRVCSYAVMLRSRVGRARLIPRGQWSIQVVPPDEAAYNSGVRTYRCLAALGYNESRTSQFGA